MKKYGAPGTALECFYFLRSQHVLPEEEEEFFRTPGEQLVSYWRWKSQQEKRATFRKIPMEHLWSIELKLFVVLLKFI